MHERDLFIAALDIDDSVARRAYLDSVCVGDAALRSRVERLLSREAAAGDFLEQPAADLCSDLDDAGPTEFSEPPPSSQPVPSSESLTMIGKPGDTAKTVLVNPASAATASSSHVTNSSPSGVTESAAALGTLFGRYRVERVLGAGGMGVVYLAEDLRLGRRVALKIPKFEADADGRFNLIERFRREARTMASVLHRNLCPIFDVDEQDGAHYLTMAFIEGETLAQAIKRERAARSGSRETSDRTLTSSATRIAELIRKLALALDEAHRAGIVHRDLKPANVMIDRGGEPILMDFGLAWMAHEADARMTQSGAIVGTPAYMSPEQAEGDSDKVGAASDLYSLGAILYELLAGQPIHTGGVTRVLFKLMHERPIPPSSVRDDVDPNLEAICWKAISRRPEDRFATAAEFAEALARFLEGRPWEDSLTRNASEGGTGPVMPGSVKRPPSLTLRVGEPDRTEVLPPDPSAETIAFQTPGEPSSMAPRGKSRIVLASLLLIGVLGAVWAIVAHRPNSADKEIVKLPDSRGIPTDDKNTNQTLPKTEAVPDHQADFALEFDGKSSHVVIPTLKRDQVEPVTIEAWVEAVIQGKSNMIVALGGKAYCSLYVRPMSWFANDPTMQSIMQSPMTKGLVHLAFVADDQEGRLFVDGKLVDRSPRTKGPDSVEETHAWLGAKLDGKNLGYFFQGRMHELSVSKIARYDGDFKPAQRFVADQHTLALYHFDEGSGNVLKDSSGNGHHGQIVGAKWVKPGEWQLFNGQDLTGWGQPQGNGKWEVKDGMLVCSAEKGGRGLLTFVGRDFENFQLHAEVRLRGLGNGGLCFDSLVPNAYRYQAEISPSNSEVSSGSLAQAGDWKWLAMKQHSLAPDGEWFDLDVLANGSQLDSKVNGQLIGSVSNTPTHQVKALTLELDGKFGPVVIEFRKLEIRELVSRPAANVPPPAKAPFDVQKARAHQESWAKHLGTTVETTNSVGAKMVLIPPGEFLMGSSDEDVALALKIAEENKLDADAVSRIQDERPRHLVRITKPFRLGMHEVTIGQFGKFIEQSGYKTQAEEFGGNSVVTKADDPHLNPANMKLNWRTPGQDVGENSPVTQVSWNDAAAFCNWLSEQEKLEPSYVRDGASWSLVAQPQGYRLPTEAEWEYACRAGTTTQYSFGDDWKEHDKFGWSNTNAGGQPRGVGLLPANPFGLYDMHGNVWEWCHDWHDGKWYARSPSDDPRGPPGASSRVDRGGSWSYTPAFSRSSSRIIRHPPAYRNHYRGFRIALISVGTQPGTENITPSTPAIVTSLVARPVGSAPPPAQAPFDAAQAKAHQEAWAKHLGVKVETENSNGMKMMLVPPGEFLMGAPDSDTDAGSTEKPQHRVRLTKAFAISATEITNRQFRQFVEATKYVTQAESDSQGAFDLNPKVRRPTLTWNNPEFNKRGEDERPVRCVSWEDARQFCEWLTQMEGRVYRLPTEAEWEFACRAGTDTRYSFGNDLSETPSPPGTNAAPLLFVAQLPANPFGLFDMHGNVNEMCWDAGRTFTPELVTDPLGSLLMNVPAVVKGGAVSSTGVRLRSSNRYLTDARQFPERDFATIVKGFRVVAEFGSPPPAKAPFDAKQARAHQEAWAKQLGTTVETTNSVGAKMILIPPGEFLMGSSDEDVALALKIAEENKLDGVGVQRIQDNERPQHFVRITKPFRLGIHEVTIGQFRKFIEQSGYKTQAEEFGGHSDATKADEPRVTPESKKLNWRTTGKEVGENSPVTLVSWNDAVAFCNWLSEQEKREPSYARDGASWMLVAQPQGYRLPTEAEWEYACRAGTTTAYSFGDDWKQLDKFGWSKSNAGGRPRGVGLLLVNPFGLYDMHGSVWEWCNDWFDAKWYARSPTDDPRGPPKSSNRVFRGGGWNNAPGDGRSSYRDNHGIPANGQLNRGFRIVAVVECAQPINASAGPLLPPPLNPGLTIHDPQWKLIEVIRPQGKVFSTRFDRQSRLCFAMPERLDDKSPPPGLYRVQPDGTHQAIVQNTDWEFAFSPDEQRCFAHRGTMGMIAEVDLKTGMSIREVDMSPSDDGPTSPHFAPTWYRGSLVNSNEYLLADFGGTKRGPPSTGGIWKFGSGMAAPQRLLTMPDGPARVHALAFGRDELFVAKFSGASSSLTTFDGQRLVDRPTEPLPSIGNMVFDPGDGSLLVSEFNGHAILRIDLAQPDRPASVKPLVSGFRRLNFGVMSLTQDGRRLAVVDFDANTIYVLDRSARDVSAAPVKQVLAAPLPSVTSATGLKLGDLDGDGDLDLFVAMLKAPCVMLRNDGKGNFTDSGQQLGDNASFALALGDLDGDGDLDAFVCNSDDQEDAIWLNDGRGLFQRSPQSFPPSKSNDVALADVDGDKDLDVVVSNWKGSVEIWTNDGAGRLTSQQTIPRINNTGVAPGDLDNDGDADLVMTSIGGDNRVWFNDGQGHFTDSEQQIELAKSTSVALGDLDGDGDLDLFITAHDGSQVWFNDGHGRLQASEQRLGDGPCEAVELVDLDADHDLDAVTIGGGFEIAKPRTVWRNDGQGRFAKDATTLKTGRSQSLTSGDLDGDGDADLVLGNLAEPAEVWLNQSNQSTIP